MLRLLAGGSAAVLAVMLSAVVWLSVAAGSAHVPSRAESANKEAAVSAAGEMLEDIQVPPGATEFPGEPPGTNPVLDETPAERRPRTIVTRARWWVSSVDTEETLDWIEEQPPLGSKLRGVGEVASSAPGAAVAHTVDVQWAPVPGVLEKRRLYFAAVNRGDGRAVLEATASVEWTVPHPPSAKIPSAARFLEVEATESNDTHRRRYTISGPKSVGRVAAAIHALPARQPQQIACPRNKVPPPTLRLTFRRALGAAVLAEAEQRWPPGYCRFFELRIHGRQQLPLSEGEKVVAAIPGLVSK